MKRVPIGCWSGGAYEASRSLRAAADTTSRLRLWESRVRRPTAAPIRPKLLL